VPTHRRKNRKTKRRVREAKGKETVWIKLTSHEKVRVRPGVENVNQSQKKTKKAHGRKKKQEVKYQIDFGGWQNHHFKIGGN